MAITRDLVRRVRSRVEDDPSVAMGLLASELGATEIEVITSLPVKMRRRCHISDLYPLWRRLERWGDSASCFFTEGGRRLSFKDGAKRLEKAGHVWFVSRPCKGNGAGGECSVRFYTGDGEELMTVRVNPGAESAAEEYAELFTLYGVKDVPPKKPCRGCSSCTCGKKETQPVIARLACACS